MTSLNPAITDPTLRAEEGGKLLSQALARESAVLAFDDVFRLVAVLGFLTALYVLYLVTLSTVVHRFNPARKATA